jgi:predicted kinase
VTRRGGRATAHLIHGFIGVGKTTFAKRLEQALPAVRFSKDAWMARLFGVDPPAADFAENDRNVLSIIDDISSRCLALGLDVVLDLGFWSRVSRDLARSRLAEIGADYRLYRLTCSDAASWSRVEARNQRLDDSLLINPPNLRSLARAF